MIVGQPAVRTRWSASGFVGYVLRFRVERLYVERFEVKRVGRRGIDELVAEYR